jgi:hypothetical protein
MAVIRRSQKDVSRILARYPSSLTERNVVGQTPLHLSCGWPLGAKLLLDAGAQDIVDVMDDFGWPTFVYACHFSCLECLELLLEADCSLFPLSQYEEPSSNLDCYSQALRKGSWDTGRRLVQSLSERRESLKALALDNLPFDEIQKLNLCNGRILDERSHDVYAALKASRITVPEALAAPSARTSVYHTWYLSPLWAEQLYNRGFHDVDILDEEGLTPLMLSSDSIYHGDDADYPFELEWWLLSHGTNLYATPKVPQKSTINPHSTAAHYFATRVGEAFCHGAFSNCCSRLDPKVHGLPKLLCSISRFDNCICGCSSRGCFPATMMFKKFYWRRPTGFGYFKYLSPIRWVTHHLPQTDESWCWLSTEAIRFLAFDALDIRHTCCTRHWNGCIHFHPEEEVEEIREEDCFRLQLLEELATEFATKYAELGVGLIEFLEGYWAKRMNNVLNQPVDEEEMRHIEAIGVILDSEAGDES